MSETPDEQGNASAEKDAKIAELESQLKALQEEVEEGSEKDARIAELQAELDKEKADHASTAANADVAAQNATSGILAAAQPVLAEKNPSPGLDVGQAEVQEKTDVISAQGFMGTQVDPTPNKNYSMETPPDAPTPETDPTLADAAKAAVDGSRFDGTTAQTDTTTTAGAPAPQEPSKPADGGSQ